MAFIMVLNDGETYSALDGCQIVEIDGDTNPDAIDRVLQFLRTQNEVTIEDDGIGWDTTGRIITVFQDPA